jgi:AraC-like DNA-binding protein
LDDAIREKNPESMVFACSGLFSLYVETGALETGIRYLQRGIDAATQLQDDHLRLMLLKELYNVYRDNSQLPQAITIGEEINTIRDSLYDLDKQAAIHELEIGYQSVRKELENKQLRIGLETQQRLNRYTIVVNLMLGAGLLIFAGMYLYIRALYRQRTNAYHVLMAHFKKEKTEKNEQESQVKLSTGQGVILDKIGHRLGRYMEQDKPYLDPNLKVDIVLDKLKISQRQLTQVLKQLGFSNFSNFVNHHRVMESRRMLEQEEFDIYTIEAIAEKAGFGTKQSFYNAFEQQTGVKPMYYRQSMRRDV